MKTIYCTIMLQPAVITISDAVLDRIRFLEQSLRTLEVPKQETPLSGWGEHRIELQCFLGKSDWAETIDDPGVLKIVPNDDGPVLVYDNDTCNDHHMRRVNDNVSITVTADGSFMSHMGYEGEEDPIDSKLILDLPDLFFSRDIIKEGSNVFLPKEIHVQHLIEDMPNKHRQVYALLISEYKKRTHPLVEDIDMSGVESCQENDSENSDSLESS